MNLKNIFLISKRILLESFGNRKLSFFWTVFPIGVLLIFSSVYSNGDIGNGFTITFPGTLVGAAMFFSCMANCVSLISIERERKTLRRLLISKIKGGEYFIGIFLAYFILALVQCFFLIFITYLFGGRFLGNIFLGVFIILLSTISYVSIGFIIGILFAKKSEDATGPAIAIGVPLLILAGTFFDFSLLPDFLQKLNRANPIFHMLYSFRNVAINNFSFSDIKYSMIFLILFSIISLFVSNSIFKIYGRKI